VRVETVGLVSVESRHTIAAQSGTAEEECSNDDEGQDDDHDNHDDVEGLF